MARACENTLRRTMYVYVTRSRENRERKHFARANYIHAARRADVSADKWKTPAPPVAPFHFRESNYLETVRCVNKRIALRNLEAASQTSECYFFRVTSASCAKSCIHARPEVHSRCTCDRDRRFRVGRRASGSRRRSEREIRDRVSPRSDRVAGLCARGFAQSHIRRRRKKRKEGKQRYRENTRETLDASLALNCRRRFSASRRIFRAWLSFSRCVVERWYARSRGGLRAAEPRARSRLPARSPAAPNGMQNGRVLSPELVTSRAHGRADIDDDDDDDELVLGSPMILKRRADHRGMS